VGSLTPFDVTRLEFRSKVARSVSASESVRATIPGTIATLLGIEPGSTLLWSIEPGSREVVVSVEAPPKKRSKD